MSERWKQIISGFRGKRILVVGDAMLDLYIQGEVERISPEAPVPVVRISAETRVPGGSANVANNISSLGGLPILAGIIGSDPAGRQLKILLRGRKIDGRALLVDPGRPTVTKSRVVAGHQQVVRIDRESPGDIRPELKKKLLSTIREIPGKIDGVILEDYGKGVVDQDLIDRLIAFARKRGCFLVVDPNGRHRFSYRGARLVSPNLKEALELARLGGEVALGLLGRTLVRKWGSDSVLITLGEEGMCLFEQRKKLFQIPTVAREVFDVSGAGDTVIGTIALALASGANLRQASRIANCAAGVVVGKLGTATLTTDELLSALNWK
jgi:D-glycero-beta-D-manno-heptose-7-phosphate kinase